MSEVELQHSVLLLLVFVLPSREMGLVVLQVSAPTWAGTSVWSGAHAKAQQCLPGWNCRAGMQVPPPIPPGATAGVVLVPC